MFHLVVSFISFVNRGINHLVYNMLKNISKCLAACATDYPRTEVIQFDVPLSKGSICYMNLAPVKLK